MSRKNTSLKPQLQQLTDLIFDDGLEIHPPCCALVSYFHYLLIRHTQTIHIFRKLSYVVERMSNLDQREENATLCTLHYARISKSMDQVLTVTNDVQLRETIRNVCTVDSAAVVQNWKVGQTNQMYPQSFSLQQPIACVHYTSTAMHCSQHYELVSTSTIQRTWFDL